MVLDIPQVEANLRPRSNGIRLGAAFCKTFDDVGFAAKEAHERHDFFTACADQLEERSGILGANDEHLFFNAIGFHLNRINYGDEGIDDVIAMIGERSASLKQTRGVRR